MSPTHRRHRWLPATILLVLVAAVGVTLFLRRQAADPSSETTAASGTAASTTTARDRTAEPARDSTRPSATRLPYTLKPEPTFVATDPPRPSDAPIEVVLTYAGYESSTGTVRANGFVSGVIEQGRTCTLTLTRGSQQIAASSTSIADATTTSCGLLETSRGVPSGTWTAVLSYSGVDSSPMEVTVP